LNFLSRLLEAAGIFYFSSIRTANTSWCWRMTAALQDRGRYDKVPFVKAQSGRTTTDSIDSWSVEQVVQPGVFATTTTILKRRIQSLLESMSRSRPYAHSGFEVFDFPLNRRCCRRLGSPGGELRLTAQAAYDATGHPVPAARRFSGKIENLNPEWRRVAIGSSILAAIDSAFQNCSRWSRTPGLHHLFHRPAVDAIRRRAAALRLTNGTLS